LQVAEIAHTGQLKRVSIPICSPIRATRPCTHSTGCPWSAVDVAVATWEAIFKAKLRPNPSHPRALPFLLEALALWQGCKVRAALYADESPGGCANGSGRQGHHQCNRSGWPFGRLRAARSCSRCSRPRRLGGGQVERQADHRAGSAGDDTLMRYFLRRRLGPLSMAPLAIGAPKPAGARQGEPAAGLANGAATRFVATAPPAISLTPITARADEEHLSTGQVSAYDEANGQHGRAAREVGHRAAAMRCSSAITAA